MTVTEALSQFKSTDWAAYALVVGRPYGAPVTEDLARLARLEEIAVKHLPTPLAYQALHEGYAGTATQIYVSDHGVFLALPLSAAKG